MNKTIYHSNLPIFDYDFPKVYTQKITSYINSLKYNDLKEISDFNKLLEDVKKMFTLFQVSFGNPKITNHREEEINIQASYEYPIAHKRNVFKINIEIQFIGSLELFNYRPNGYNHGVNDFEIYQPYDNQISFEVTSVSLSDKEKIIQEAEKKMQLTYQFINSNNKFVDAYNNLFKDYIETKLSEYRNNLLTLYN